MKRLNLLLFFLAVGLFVTSCKKEDSKKTPETELFGKWSGEYAISSTTRNGMEVESDTIFFTGQDFYHLDFQKNGQCTFISSFGGENSVLNLFYKVENDTIILDVEEKFSDPEIHSFTIKGKKFMLFSSRKFVEEDVTWDYSSQIHFKR